MSGMPSGYPDNGIVAPPYVSLYSPFQSRNKMPLRPPPPPPPLPPLLPSYSQPSSCLTAQNWTADEEYKISLEVAQPLFCKLCDAHLNSPQQATCHYQGKNHKKKLRRYVEMTKATSTNAIATVTPSQEAAETTMKFQKKDDDDTNSETVERPQKKFKGDVKLEDMYCKFCDVVFSSAVHAKEHYEGRNHLRRTGYYNPTTKKWQKEPVNGSSYNNPVLSRLGSGQPAGQQKSFMMCKQNQNVNQQDKLPSLVTDVEDSILASVMATAANCEIPSKRASISSDFSMYRTPSGKYYCSNCNLTLNSEAQLVQHFDSKKHKSSQGDFGRYGGIGRRFKT